MERQAGVAARGATGPSDGDSVGRASLPFSFARSPGWLFHLIVAVPMAYLIWAYSTPALGPTLLWLGSGLGLSVAALVWAVWLLTWGISGDGTKRPVLPGGSS